MLSDYFCYSYLKEISLFYLGSVNCQLGDLQVNFRNLFQFFGYTNRCLEGPSMFIRYYIPDEGLIFGIRPGLFGVFLAKPNGVRERGPLRKINSPLKYLFVSAKIMGNLILDVRSLAS